MKLKQLSLRIRIFLAMILLVLIAAVLIAAVTLYQYNEETEDYHKKRLERKEESVNRHINSVLRSRDNTYEVKTTNIPLIFKEKIYEIATIHNLQIDFYDLDGGLLKSSKATIEGDSLSKCLKAETLNSLSNTIDHRYIRKSIENDETYQSLFIYINDQKFKPITILKLSYEENDEFASKELKEFFVRLGFAYLIMFFLAIVFAYFVSKYIIKSLKRVSDKINETRLEKRNKKIDISATSEEISTLVMSYNSMIDELEESAVKLATSEREQAWREMAKQVAHEIKNPLTPMRLSVQSFQRKFNPKDENILQKVDEYSKTLIQQIDTMSSIASAFSNFAKMPAQKNEMLNVVKIVKLALDIFTEDYIEFHAEEKNLIAKFDRTQLIRVVTNLVKNAIQSIPENQDPKITVTVKDEIENISIIISDNGIGITEENESKVFEPKFTTKTSGMGLGLAMVKNIVETYSGNITFTSNQEEGTTFKVTFPKE